MKPPQNIPPQNPDDWQAMISLLDKLVALGWVERAKSRAEFSDVRFTTAGMNGMSVIWAIDKKLGGLGEREWRMLTYLAYSSRGETPP